MLSSYLILSSDELEYTIRDEPAPLLDAWVGSKSNDRSRRAPPTPPLTPSHHSGTSHAPTQEAIMAKRTRKFDDLSSFRGEF